MAEHVIGQLLQHATIAGGIRGDRFTRAVGAGGHHHPTAVLQQQMLQAAAGPHHPQPGAAASYRL